MEVENDDNKGDGREKEAKTVISENDTLQGKLYFTSLH